MAINKTTRISPKDISGDEIGIISDLNKRDCRVCGKSDMLRNSRVGKMNMVGKDVVIRWYWVCDMCNEKIVEFMTKIRNEKDKQ